jgi:hypothetical protein
MSRTAALHRLAEQARKMMKRIVLTNFGLVATQAITAGLLMSGSVRALKLHALVGLALAGGAVVQAVAARVLWRQRRVSGRTAGAAIGLIALVALQIGLGYSRRYWLHVPIGVLLFGALMKHAGRSDPPRGN